MNTGMMKAPAKKTSGNYFTQHWRGDLSLPKSFWINVIVIHLIVNNVTLLGSRLGSGDERSFSSEAEAAGYALGLLLAPMLIAVWQYTGAWRSASRYLREGGKPIWAYATKGAIILGVLGFMSLIVLSFSRI